METSAWAVLGAVGVQTLAIVFAAIRWAFTRNIDSADATVSELKTKQEAQAKDIADLRTSIAELRSDLRQLIAALPELKGTLQEMARGFEEAHDRQASFYRAELDKLAQLLRQDMTRVVSPDLPLRLEKLDERVRTLEAAKKRR